MAKKQILTSLGDTDLLERLSDAKEELFNLRFQLVTGQLENHTRVREVKKEVARLLTAMRVREIDAAEALEAVGEDVHDEDNQLSVGDRVRVQETRPLSKLKRWRLVEILERAK